MTGMRDSGTVPDGTRDEWDRRFSGRSSEPETRISLVKNNILLARALNIELELFVNISVFKFFEYDN